MNLHCYADNKQLYLSISEAAQQGSIHPSSPAYYLRLGRAAA